ncbi:MAG: 16S rRNA (cytidine(1402)-2'-O)-methyltransferase, partial [Alphaproteobacteria bacterium]
ETGTLADLAQTFAGDTKGEAVILVAGSDGAALRAGGDWEAALTEAMGQMPLRAAVDQVSVQFGLKRKQVYDAALALKAST